MVAEAREVSTELDAWNGRYLFGRDSYWLAAVAAWSGDSDGAVSALTHAFDEGLPIGNELSQHGDVFLEPLRRNAAYERLVRRRS